jgi:hypothetical protein
VIHRESLVTKEICPDVSEVMDTAIKTVNCIKTRPLKSRRYTELCEGICRRISHSCFTVIIAGCQEEMLWLVFTTCEKE